MPNSKAEEIARAQREAEAQRRKAVLLISVDEPYSEALGAAAYPRLRILRSVPHPAQIAQIAKSAAVELVLVDLDDIRWDADRIEEVIEAVRQAVENVPLAVACRDISVSTMLPAMRAGATDACDKEAPVDETVAQIERLLRSRKVERQREKGKLFAVMGARRGVGATSLATALALNRAHAAGPGERTLLLDFGEVPAPTPDILGLLHAYSATDGLRDLGRLDEALIEGAFTALREPRMYVLPVARTPDMFREVAPNELANLTAVLQTYFTTVVADLNPVSFPALTERLFLEADHAILCCDQTLPAIHSAAMALDRLRSLSGGEPAFSLAVSRYSKALQPSAQEICETLAHKGATYILPDDRLNVDRARNAGLPLVGPNVRTPFAKAVEELSGKVFATATRAQPRQSRRALAGFAMLRRALGGRRSRRAPA